MLILALHASYPASVVEKQKLRRLSKLGLHLRDSTVIEPSSLPCPFTNLSHSCKRKGGGGLKQNSATNMGLCWADGCVFLNVGPWRLETIPPAAEYVEVLYQVYCNYKFRHS